MPEENTTANAQANTSGGEGASQEAQNTASANAGAGTETAQTPADEKRFTQAEVDAMFQKRLAKAVKTELKKMGEENDGQPSVEELKSRAEAAEDEARGYRTRELVRDHLTDPKNRIGALPENMRAIEKLVMAEIEYDDGKPSNLTDAIKTVKSDAPGLFLQTGSANGGAGRQAPPATGMDSIIRQNVGR